MLDAESMAGLRILTQRRVERVQHDAVTTVADCMHVDLESVLQSLLCPAFDVLGCRNQQTGVVGLVAVRREQRGPPRAERAVRVELDGTDPEVTIVERALRSALDVRIVERLRR